MIFGKAKKAENVENIEVPAGAYVRNEIKGLVNQLIFAPAEVRTTQIGYDTHTVSLPGTENKKEFDSIEHIVNPSKQTIPIHIGSRKLAKHRYYNENPELNLVPTDLREEGLDIFFGRVMDSIIHYRMKGYNIKIVNGLEDSNYCPIESKDFETLKNCLGFKDKTK